MSTKSTKVKSPRAGKHSRTNTADPGEILEELGRLVKSYAECSEATPPIPPKPSGSRRIDRIANDVFYLAMRTFVAESRAVSILRAQESLPASQLDSMDGKVTDTDETQPSRAKLRVAIPPNHFSGVVVPVMSPPPSADEFRELPNAVRGIRDSLDVCASETRLDEKAEDRGHWPPAPESKSPVIVELETELDETKSTLQDIRLRERLLQTRNDVLARQAERVRSACGVLLEGHFDDASWRGVFDESSYLLQSHPLSRLRVGLACFTAQLTSALKAFHDEGTWTRVTAGGLGSIFHEVCGLLNDLMDHAKGQYLPPSKPRARSHSVPVATLNGYPARPPVRPKPSSLRSPTKVSSPGDESKRER